MDSNSSRPAGNSPPPKPWDRAGASSGPTPFKPPSAGSTSDVVEASGTANPGEIISSSQNNPATNRNSLGRPVPTRPWERNNGTSNNYVGGYGSTSNYNSGLCGSYGGFGGYGSGMYGNSMYNRGGYGGLNGSAMYGGGIYNGGYGSSMGGYGMGMGGPYGAQDPGPPSSPPGFWISFLRVMQGVVNFFGRVSMLIDQNTQAFHMFMTALLQLFDRSGMLYGELARFVLRILGIRTKSRQAPPLGPNGLAVPGFHNPPTNQNSIEGPKAARDGSWDSVWVHDSGK